jgi:hypothetical protein
VAFSAARRRFDLGVQALQMALVLLLSPVLSPMVTGPPNFSLPVVMSMACSRRT